MNNLNYYFDGKCSVADLGLFVIMDGFEELFGADSFNKYVVSTHPYLAKIYNKLKERESIKRLMAKQKVSIFKNIIFKSIQWMIVHILYWTNYSYTPPISPSR